MKDLWKNGVIILLIVGVLYILWLRECKHPLPCPPKGQVLVLQKTWDSILALADKPAEVKIETLKVKGNIIYVSATPIPVPVLDSKDTTINNYTDSLITDSIDVHIDLGIRGILLSRSWRFTPIIWQIKRDSIIYVPHIIEVEKPVIKVVNSLYIYGMAGGNANSFLFGGGLDFTTKKNTELGYMYQRFGNDNFHSVKLGVKLLPRH